MTNLTRRQTIIMAGSSLLLASRPAMAAEHSVEMLNFHPEDEERIMVFHPRLIVVKPGDQVTFVPTDDGHNSVSIKGMLPDGAEGWNGDIGSAVTASLEKPGFYGYKCLPHSNLGMVGLIVVEGPGMHDNLEAAMKKKHLGRAKKAFREMFAEADAMGLLV